MTKTLYACHKGLCPYKATRIAAFWYSEKNKWMFAPACDHHGAFTRRLLPRGQLRRARRWNADNAFWIAPCIERVPRRRRSR